MAIPSECSGMICFSVPGLFFRMFPLFGSCRAEKEEFLYGGMKGILTQLMEHINRQPAAAGYTSSLSCGFPI